MIDELEQRVIQMDAELKAKWVATLRAGTFTKTLGVLRNRENHCCCLGVLCDISRPDQWHRGATGAWMHASHTSLPDQYALKQWGLNYHEAETLANMNDSGKSFPEIADYIEANIPADPPAVKTADGGQT